MCRTTEALSNVDQTDDDDMSPPVVVTSNAGVGDELNLIPPLNFAMVDDGIFRLMRSSCFKLELKVTSSSGKDHVGIITCIPEIAETAMELTCSENIKETAANEPFVNIPQDTIREALKVVLDVRNHPVLIHCKLGKHRTGCLVGCLRKLQRWCLSSVFDEYQRLLRQKLEFLIRGSWSCSMFPA